MADAEPNATTAVPADDAPAMPPAAPEPPHVVAEQPPPATPASAPVAADAPAPAPTATATPVDAPASEPTQPRNVAFVPVDTAMPAPRSNPEGRSATFSGQTPASNMGLSTAMQWRNKAASCEGIRSFEANRKAKIDAFQEQDRLYWHHFEKEILHARDENHRLQRFFALRMQADLAYAEALRKIRPVLERPISGAGASPGGAAPGAAGSGLPSLDSLALTSSCARAFNSLGEVQQQLSEKIVQFTTVVKRDVIARPFEEMVANFEERAATMLADGNRLDAMLHEAQKQVVEAFSRYDGIYREMEAERYTNAQPDLGQPMRKDLWLAEIAYGIAVHRLKQTRVEYVKGMSSLFQLYKSLEVLRVSVIQTSLDTYIRKQKLTYDELAGALSEPMAAAQKIDPERDLVNSIRRIPRSHTASSLASEDAEQSLFGMLRSPLSSPLLVRCGFLKHQVSGSIFKSWKDVLCAITQDQFLHLIELKENATRSITSSSEAMLEAIMLTEQTHEVACMSISLANCKINMIGKSSVPSFEVLELSQSTGLFGSMFRMESRRTFTFQCANQSDLIDWVVAAKRFIS
ncbi:TPA: hypothetical protein N0F65_011356 [Lagenidium giganteum]|uniref:PH domain-containing protein n=1 Tax=Lagenidium giganteum TaxID=4803 RepID=A0AAV2Z775_9STRA|nr:TPA: hypothetical protein N0F65_011356 [Lagenidium giganteum]